MSAKPLWFRKINKKNPQNKTMMQMKHFNGGSIMRFCEESLFHFQMSEKIWGLLTWVFMLGHIYCVGSMTMLPNSGKTAFKSFNYAKLIIHLVIKGRVSGIFLRNNCICSNHALCFPVCFFLFSSWSHSQAVKYVLARPSTAHSDPKGTL